MSFLLKMMKFFSLDMKAKWMFIEAFWFLGSAKILLLTRPFVKLAPTLGIEMQETSSEETISNQVIAEQIANAIRVMSRHTFWKSQCFVKAIAGMKMLSRRDIDCTIYFGVARDENGKMIAHAWLRNGSFYVSGKEGMERFTVVNHFANMSGV